MSDGADVDFEHDEGAEEALSKVRKLKEELKACQREKQEYMDGWQRAKADYVNSLKRFDEEKKAERERGVLKAVDVLLPAFDALERAKDHGDIPDGFSAIAKQLESAFSALGIAAFGEAGERFDPARHEALGQDPTDACEHDDEVSSILEKGLLLADPADPSGQGRVVRPAKVRVYHFEG